MKTELFHAAGDIKAQIALKEDSMSIVSLGAFINTVKVLGPEGHPLAEDESLTLEHYLSWIQDSAQILREQPLIINAQLPTGVTVTTGDERDFVAETLFVVLLRGDQCARPHELNGDIAENYMEVLNTLLPPRLCQQLREDLNKALDNEPVYWKARVTAAMNDILDSLYQRTRRPGSDTLRYYWGSAEQFYYFNIRITNAILGNRMFVTDKGHVGIGLNAIEVGDSVVLLSGGLQSRRRAGI